MQFYKIYVTDITEKRSGAAQIHTENCREPSDKGRVQLQ